MTCSCLSISRTTCQKDSIFVSKVLVPFALVMLFAPMPLLFAPLPIPLIPPALMENDAAGAVCNNTPPRTIHAVYATRVVMMTWRVAKERSKGV